MFSFVFQFTQLVSFPLLPALAMFIYNLIQMGLTIDTLLMTQDLQDTLTKMTPVEDILDAIQQERDGVSVYVGKDSSTQCFAGHIPKISLDLTVELIAQ